MSAHYFIADAHIGAGNPLTEQHLLDFLAAIRGHADSLYLLGDLFDFWFEYRHLVPSHSLRLLSRIAELRNTGVKVIFLRGNHDCRLNSNAQPLAGDYPVYDELATTIDGKRVFACHGDAADRRIVSTFFRRLMRSRIAGVAYSLLHPELGTLLVRLAVNCSRRFGNRDYLQQAMADFARHKLNSGFDIVFMAHSHVPEVRHYGSASYVNVGGWLNSCTYGIVRDGKAALEQFRCD